jgi:hypothetical protein
MRKESYSKIQNESYYTSPPYNYRPSIAEYLSTADVTKKGFIAEIMHMDFKGNIKIVEFNPDFLNIKLLKKDGLDITEIHVWDYLESIKLSNQIKLYPNKIPRSTISNFSGLVRIKTNQKFNSGIFRFNYSNQQDNNQITKSLFAYRIIVGFIMNFLGFLGFFAFIAGMIKLSKQKYDTKFFLKKFVLRYVIINLLYLTYILLISSFFKSILIKNFQIPILFLFGILILFAWLIFFYQYSKISFDYLNWLFETKEVSEHRKNWLEFKKFVIDNSEVEKKPLAHYILWGPFYYYTLAVGGIKKIEIR